MKFINRQNNTKLSHADSSGGAFFSRRSDPGGGIATGALS